MSAGKASLIGTIIDGRYFVEEELGAGGFAAVYLASDVKVMQRKVVVKMLLEDSRFGDSFDVAKTFHKEAEALSRLDHPNVVTLLDYGKTDGGHPFLVLQFIDGKSLRHVIRPGGIDFARSAHIIRQVSRALTAAHDKGVLHRDLKPENVMLQAQYDEERVVVIDFGIARIQDPVITQKTVTVAAPGTIYYMSPEQLTAEELTPASDVYALGVIAYELLTGEKPFSPKSPYQLLEMQRAGESALSAGWPEGLPEPACEALRRSLSFEPDQRFPRARDFGDEFYKAVLGASAARAYAVGAKGVADPDADADLDDTRDLAEASARRPRLFASPLAVAGLLCAGLLCAGTFFALGRAWGSVAPTPAPTPAQEVNAASAPPAAHNEAAAPVGEETALNYSFTIQRMRGGKQYKEPFESTGEVIFENDWRFSVNLSVTRPGSLYILNEGLNAGGATIYTILFPLRGDAHIEADRKMQIPEAPDNYYFTGETGTEKYWIVWSAQPIPELESLLRLVNDEDQGEVKDPDQVKAVRSLLADRSSPAPEVNADRSNKRVTVKTRGDRLIHLSELEYR
jgi:tRNA A-37 threonylcarbamoyl transferase component Bud32